MLVKITHHIHLISHRSHLSLRIHTEHIHRSILIHIRSIHIGLDTHHHLRSHSSRHVRIILLPVGLLITSHHLILIHLSVLLSGLQTRELTKISIGLLIKSRHSSLTELSYIICNNRLSITGVCVDLINKILSHLWVLLHDFLDYKR